MNWKLINIEQETCHPFLNFFTLHYEVENDGVVSSYSYFLASRHSKEEIRALTHEYGRPDGVIMLLYRKDFPKGETSILVTKQFRPAIGQYLLSFPAGLMDPNDNDPLETARREAKEEAGALLGNCEVIAPSSPTSSGLSDECCSFVFGEVVGCAERKLEEFEDISVSWMPCSDLKRALNDPKILIPLNIRLASLYFLSRFGEKN